MGIEFDNGSRKLLAVNIYICLMTTGLGTAKIRTNVWAIWGNYRPIALASVIYKVLEMALLVKLEKYLYSSDYQFGFKPKHSTDLCIYSLKEVIEFYKSPSSSVYVCFMDASKAFDRVNHWTLFKKTNR